MPRTARFVLPQVPLHVRHRGHNRNQCFFGERDYRTYLDYLAFFAERHGCAVHAYCLMTNHVHVFLTPAREDSCALLMKFLAQCYTQSINKKLGRSGSLWEGRFRSCPVTSDEYALACYRYIETNPVRARLVAHPREYPWSSFEANSRRERTGFLSPHPAYANVEDYVALVEADLGEKVVEDIRKATTGGFAVGAPRKPRGRQMRKIGSVPI